MIRQAIIPLAGLGTRLLPLTSVYAKELLPINGKIGLEYILDECIEAGIKEIIIITTPEDQTKFHKLLGDGSKFGIKLYYQIQEKPEGLAQSFQIAKKF